LVLFLSLFLLLLLLLQLFSVNHSKKSVILSEAVAHFATAQSKNLHFVFAVAVALSSQKARTEAPGFNRAKSSTQLPPHPSHRRSGP